MRVQFTIPWSVVLVVALSVEFVFLWWRGLDLPSASAVTMYGIVIAALGGQCDLALHRSHTSCDK